MRFPVLSIIGMILFLYLTWRNLKDDYRSDNLIAFSWLALLVFLIGGRVTYGLANWGDWNSFGDWIMFYKTSGINLVGGYIILLILVTGLIQVYGWKLWSFLDDIISNVMILVIGFWLAGVDFANLGTKELVWMAIFVFCFWMSALIGNRYRSFVWYRSGKKGFKFFFTNMIFFLLLSVYYLIMKQMVFFGALFFIALICLGGLIILGEVLDPLLINIKRRKL